MSDKSGTRGDRMLMGRFLAAVDQLAHTGMTEFEAAYDDELGELSPVEVLWRCEGKWQGTRLFSAHFSYPAQAAEDLLGRVVNGGLCTSCRNVVVIGLSIDGYCSRTLVATDIDDEHTYRYVKTCAGSEESQ